ncbi:hypothetical protein CPAR01_02862 [Colletotrichum paranaense]|uniref:Uncharacterized protein n=5 Tax=Colletotrichum acutatum species complex TaxID=2707335 RepID=A0A9Q0B8X6_9PEZI|nr:uncharacterized protein CCOS01_13642 [Colletotrichum costaricense]XP_060354477.1 uncharacterized protein CPAR01_02862 [Colletotrichum paranaense]XP_060390629.1 uncharacterized protein CABS01_04413 [Colletotrichum abscissum]KAK0378755.1 hypothetical protein CLIM01_03864 [Colletotrichum limetticola]KAK1452087.1 hypothetical protein CMEL01_06661 [Colletotrichum melonis]KAI3556277.1 hypothetical protein CABS02_03560 [Colletotrichum abscissum]KAK1473751.1 hypothetical protein CABS01_04413 [Coll
MSQHGGRVDQQPTIVIRWNSPTAASLKLPTESH